MGNSQNISSMKKKMSYQIDCYCLNWFFIMCVCVCVTVGGETWRADIGMLPVLRSLEGMRSDLRTGQGKMSGQKYYFVKQFFCEKNNQLYCDFCKSVKALWRADI